MTKIPISAIRRGPPTNIDATAQSLVAEEPCETPQEEDHPNPVAILALDVITHQVRALATIDAARLPWLEANPRVG